MEPEHHDTLSPSSFPALQHSADYLPRGRRASPVGAAPAFTR